MIEVKIISNNGKIFVYPTTSSRILFLFLPESTIWTGVEKC